MRASFAVLAPILVGACTSDPAEGDARTTKAEALKEAPVLASLVVDTATIPACLRPFHAVDFPVEGWWDWNWLPGYDSTALCVKRTGESSFELEFLRSTDFSPPVEHSTKATWSGAGLVLELANEWMPTVLYPARVAGEECLVPDVSLARLEKGARLWPESPRSAECDDNFEFAFRRAEDELVEKRQVAWKAFFESIDQDDEE